MALAAREPHHLGHFACHHRLATPVSPWERLKIGAALRHPDPARLADRLPRVSEVVEPGNGGQHLCYSAG